MNRSEAQGESGLSLVEVLVALAITSLLSMAVVWLLSTAARVRDVSELVGRSDQALIRLVGLAANLSQIEPHAVRVGGEGTIEIVYEPVGMPPYTATVEITRNADAGGLMLRATGASLPEVAVDLSAFEEGVMEIFARNETGGEWRDANFWPLDTQVGGIRLRLSSMSRTWFPILWSRTRGMDAGDQ